MCGLSECRLAFIEHEGSVRGAGVLQIDARGHEKREQLRWTDSARSGSGPRGEVTWRTRMRRLQELGFILSKPGVAGEFQFVLILNPFLAIDKLYSDKPKDVAYNALLSRMAQVGASDLDI